MDAAQEAILHINQIQMLLSEKRTALAVMRTGIALLAVPLSIFSLLIATSKMYEIAHVWLLLSFVSLFNFLLIAFALYLIIRSLKLMHRYEEKITGIKASQPYLKELI